MTIYACKNGTVKAERIGGKMFIDITAPSGEKREMHGVNTFVARKNIESAGCDVAAFDKEFGVRSCASKDMPFNELVSAYDAMKGPLKSRLERLRDELHGINDEVMKKTGRSGFDAAPLARRARDAVVNIAVIEPVVNAMAEKHGISMGQSTMQVKGTRYKPSAVVKEVAAWLDENPLQPSLVNYMAIEKLPGIDCDVVVLKAGMQHVANAFLHVIGYSPNPEKNVYIDDIEMTLDQTRAQNVRRVRRSYGRGQR